MQEKLEKSFSAKLTKSGQIISRKLWIKVVQKRYLQNPFLFVCYGPPFFHKYISSKKIILFASFTLDSLFGMADLFYIAYTVRLDISAFLQGL